MAVNRPSNNDIHLLSYDTIERESYNLNLFRNPNGGACYALDDGGYALVQRGIAPAFLFRMILFKSAKIVMTY